MKKLNLSIVLVLIISIFFSCNLDSQKSVASSDTDEIENEAKSDDNENIDPYNDIGANSTTDDQKYDDGLLKDWVKYENEEFNFKVKMPSTPETSKQSVNTTLGDIEQTMFISASETGAYFVAFSPLPLKEDVSKEEIMEALESGQNMAISRFQDSKLIESKAIKKDQYYGLKFKATGKANDLDFIYEGEFFYKEKNLVMCYLLNSSSAYNKKITEEFLKSFEL